MRFNTIQTTLMAASLSLFIGAAVATEEAPLKPAETKQAVKPEKIAMNLKSVFVAEGALEYCQAVKELPASYVKSVLDDFRSRAPGYKDAARGFKEKNKLIGREKIRKEGPLRAGAACKVFTHVIIERLVRKQTPIEKHGQFKLLADDPVRFDEKLLYNHAFCAGYFEIFGFGVSRKNEFVVARPMLQKMLMERDSFKSKLEEDGVDENEKQLYLKGKSVASEDIKTTEFGLPAKRIRMCQALL